ncbi:MAG TPA: hypothetical protein VJ723_12985 [Candidatus Angelobacter sp.]|nr:hypothetical protein [Candidatus Angelobacter sp.]
MKGLDFMERRHPYKGFVIEAHPYQLRGVSGWKTEFNIEKHDGAGVTDTRFYFEKSHVFDTQEGAIQAAIMAGRQEIDAGFAPNAEQALTMCR